MVWVIVGFRNPVRVTSEGKLAGELSGTKGALVNVWEMCLCVEGP
jgi:hypothetical protein